MPSDVTGVSVYSPQTHEFTFHPGPIFANIVIADEINRASPKPSPRCSNAWRSSR